MARFSKGTPEQAARLYFDSAVFGNKKSPNDRTDFGESDTVGLNLRRVGVRFNDPNFPQDECFGVYLGCHHGQGWVVANKKFDLSGLAGCELFDSLEDLKCRWELD